LTNCVFFNIVHPAKIKDKTYNTYSECGWHNNASNVSLYSSFHHVHKLVTDMSLELATCWGAQWRSD